MKKALLIFLLCPLFCFSQRSHTYLQLTVDDHNYQGNNPIFGGSVEFGTKGKILGLGVGASATKFKGASGPYIPVYLDLSAYSNKRLIRPIFQCKFGYGILNNTNVPPVTQNGGSNNGTQNVNQNGGVYVNPSIGLLLPVKRTDLLVAIGYMSSDIKTNYKSAYTTQSFTSSIKGWNLSIGVRL